MAGPNDERSETITKRWGETRRRRNQSINGPTFAKSYNTKKKGGDGGGSPTPSRHTLPVAAPVSLTSLLPPLSKICLKFFLGATVTLYVLNQKHLLPKPLGSLVSRALFWPSLPITVASRIGRWSSIIDNTVVLGGAPFGFIKMPKRLYDNYGIRAVINLCDEYRGPTRQFEKLGMRHLWLRTVDHFEPSVKHLIEAVSFIQNCEAEGERVYVHCRAGHGRSAAVVFAWLLYKNPLADPEELNAELVRQRNVRKTLWQQPNINEFRTWLALGGSINDDGNILKKRSRHGYSGIKPSRRDREIRSGKRFLAEDEKGQNRDGFSSDSESDWDSSDDFAYRYQPHNEVLSDSEEFSFPGTDRDEPDADWD